MPNGLLEAGRRNPAIRRHPQEARTVRWPRRTRFVVDTKLQISVLLITVGYVGFLLLVVSVSLFAPLVLQLRHVGTNSAEAANAALSILYLHDRFWLPVLLALVVIVLHSLRTTHRIAGPLYRFRRVFEAVRDGVLPKPVKLRKGDYLGAEMDAINGTLASLRGRIGQVQKEAEELHQSLTRYRERSGAPDQGAVADSLWDDIVSTDRQLREALDWYKIQD
jgi:methyl-accepting chemotaxis protein